MDLVEVESLKFELYVVTLPDRRNGCVRTKWLVSSELELLLFGNVSSTGALRKLVGRTTEATGSTQSALTLRSSSVGGPITATEWDAIRELMAKGARVISLLPLDLAVEAMRMYGKEPHTKAILAALGRLPPDWASSDEEGSGSDGGSDGGSGDDDGGSSGEGGASGGGGGGGSDSDGDGSGGGGDGEEDGEEEDEGEEGEEGEGSGDEQREQGCDGEIAMRRAKCAKYMLDPVPPQLEAQLASFAKYRTAPLNTDRQRAACEETTFQTDRGNVLRFLGYLQAEKSVDVKGIVQVFASPRLAVVVQQYVEHLVAARGNKYSSAGKVVLSIAAVARFVHAGVKRASGANAAKLDASVLNTLVALHGQCVAQSKKMDAFKKSTKPTNWLSWRECQLARVSVEQQCLREASEGEVSLGALHDCALMTLLTYQPPDRVGIYRTLNLGASLLPTADGGYQLNVAEPGAHKTISVFGKTRTTMPRAVCQRISAYVEAANLQAGMYLFYTGNDASKPLVPSSWTTLVKACFKRHSARRVPLAPKELRSAFITHLKSEECGADGEVLRAAAIAMRHSSKTQASAAYDKNENDKSIAAAARFAESYAARFSPASSSSAA